jgi:molybdate transport system substrate-binding protein
LYPAVYYGSLPLDGFPTMTAVRTLAALATALLLTLPSRAADAPIVFAAASLRESMDAVAAAYEAKGGKKVRVSYGASSALARQIEAGAPAELFISADIDWVDYVETRKLTQGPRANLLTNDLVLIAPAASPLKLQIAPGFALAAALGEGRLAVADPASVPAGKYARASLEALGVWSQVSAKLAPAENVRAALALVARAETPLGIVYRTDALAEPRVRVVDALPKGTHPAIVYPLIALRGASAEAREFAAFAASPEARAIWARHGFGFP